MKNSENLFFGMYKLASERMVECSSVEAVTQLICDLASENRPYDIFNLNEVISIML